MFFIDEIQYMKQNELGALIAAIHRANQLGYLFFIQQMCQVVYKRTEEKIIKDYHITNNIKEFSGYIQRLDEYKQWGEEN